MTKYLFILAAMLTLVVGCKGTTNNNIGSDAATDNDSENAAVNDDAEASDGNESVAVNDDAEVSDGNENVAVNDDAEMEDGSDASDTNDNYAPDDECPNGTGTADCSTRSLCPSGPYGLAMCKGDMILRCATSPDPCWSGTIDKWDDCAEAGERCFSTEEEGCGGACRPLAAFKPAASFEGQWREIEDPGYTGKTIELLSFPALNEFNVRWSGDAQTYTGAYENSQIGEYLTTRWSFNAPYAVTTFCDYRILLDGDTITLKFMGNTGYWDDCLSYMGEKWQSQDHIFERIPEEQPDDDALLTDMN